MHAENTAFVIPSFLKQSIAYACMTSATRSTDTEPAKSGGLPRSAPTESDLRGKCRLLA